MLTNGLCDHDRFGPCPHRAQRTVLEADMTHSHIGESLISALVSWNTQRGVLLTECNRDASFRRGQRGWRKGRGKPQAGFSEEVTFKLTQEGWVGVGQVSLGEFSLFVNQFSIFKLEKGKQMWQRLLEVPLQMFHPSSLLWNPSVTRGDDSACNLCTF